ncbi:MAG TPA: glycosyltransferase family 2 protein [Dehalococcoidia bacterium]|nr:glycosyltransferase family 2 protein [Dehalococcoidia bacterium]
MKARPTIAAIVLARNEARHIAACLATLAWADERIVLDSYSDDGTAEIAARMGAQVHQRPFDDFARQRNAAIGLAHSDWVLFVDADERVTLALAQEVHEVLSQVATAGAPVGFWLPRRNRILGRWMRATGWWPDHQLRLFRRDRGRYREDRLVHELVVLDGPEGYLAAPLLHENYSSFGDLLRKQRRYAAYDAAILGAAGRVRPRHLLSQPLREFWRRFVTWHGYRDGFHGLFLSLFMAWYAGLVHYRALMLGPLTAVRGPTPPETAQEIASLPSR